MVKIVVRDRFDRLLAGEEIADSIQVFIKQEPHKVAKINEGRFRLISGVSMVDGIVDRILFQDLHAKIVPTLGDTPSMIGWNPYENGEILFRDFHPSRFALDKSLWDWTVPSWLVDLWLEFILGMSFDCPQWYRDLVTLRFKMLFELSKFEFADGSTYVQQDRGIMKSGCFLTLLLNTVGQIIVHKLACDKIEEPTGRIKALGDDTFQETPDKPADYVAAVRSFGFLPKEPKIMEHIEFAGFVLADGLVVPAYWQKHLYLLKHLEEKVAVDTLQSYQRLYAFKPDMLRLVQLELAKRSPRDVLPDFILRRNLRRGDW